MVQTLRKEAVAEEELGVAEGEEEERPQTRLPQHCQEG